jgi:hypothetical protein
VEALSRPRHLFKRRDIFPARAVAATAQNRRRLSLCDRYRGAASSGHLFRKLTSLAAALGPLGVSTALNCPTSLLTSPGFTRSGRAATALPPPLGGDLPDPTATSNHL